ncbi:MAG TPA: hypothetical protein DD626_02660, partial [Clostridiales bacterium]|nr:hypothetical protein [Clostridiales bacterium]
LGAEGMGMYQLVFPVYALFMVLATAGIPTSLSRTVAEKRALGENVKKYFAVAMCALLVLGLAFGLLMGALSDVLAKRQGNADTRFGFLIIAPAITFVCVISGFRGYFQGQMYMLPTALSNVVEQVVKLAVGIGASYALAKKGVIYAVCGALFGVTVSEIVTAAYMGATYLFRSKKGKREGLAAQISLQGYDMQSGGENDVLQGETSVRGDKNRDNADGRSRSAKKARFEKVSRGELKGMLKVALPIAAVAALMPLANFFDSVIIVNMLKAFGLKQSVATAQYGIISGPVNSLINMPVVVIMSLAVAVVPSVSASRATRDIDGVMLKSSLCVRLAYLLGIPFAFYLAVFARNVIGALYPALSEQNTIVAVNVLRITAANVVFLSVMQIYVSLFQAVDKTKYAVFSLIAGIIVKIVLDVVLTMYIGINGAAIASLALPVVAYFCTLVSYYKICGLRLEKNVGLNLLSGVIMALCGIAVGSLIKNDVASLAVGFAVCAVVYVWLAFLFNLVGKDDIPHLPLKKLLWALHRTIRFWEYNNETR